jgi:hypothetical protein
VRSGGAGAATVVSRAPAPNGEPGTIVARDGGFYDGATQVVMHGFNTRTWSASDQLFAAYQAAGVNFLRVHLDWYKLESVAPTQEGSTWSHTWEGKYITEIRQLLDLANEYGMYVLLQGLRCSTDVPTCPAFGEPDYLSQAPYNSHETTYEPTDDGIMAFRTDFWTDELRQRFMTDAWLHVVSEVKDEPALIGYEPINEPGTGTYPDAHETTQMTLDLQLQMAQAIRAEDPGRMIVFMTREGYDIGLPNADLSGWEALGNVAADVHDYVGARWGNSFANDPGKDNYLEATQLLFLGTFTDPAITYGGTVQGHGRFFDTLLAPLEDTGIPLMVGEFGTNCNDPGAAMYYGTLLTAMTARGLSWAGWWSGPLGITDGDGTQYSFATVVLDAI